MNHFKSNVECRNIFPALAFLLATTLLWANDAPKPAETPKPPAPPAKPAEPAKPPYKPYLRVMPDRALTQPDRDLIQLALPSEPIVKPKKPRKLLIFDLNVDYGGHRSIVCANFAFTQLGTKTKAFEAVVAHEAAAFQEENLKQYDAVVFNNTVGNVFGDATLRKNLEQFVRNGGGLLGLHGATEAFVHYDGEQVGKDDWPLFGEMLGARGMKHREADERVFVRIEDASHPLVQCFPKEGFFYRDEIPRFTGPYSRQRQRILLSLDNAKSFLRRPPYGELKERPDEDYALVWVKTFGKGRCCYSAFGHHPRVFWDPMMLRFYLGAIQFVLGDLEGSTTPSAPPPPPAPAPAPKPEVKPQPAPAPAPAPKPEAKPQPSPAPAPAPKPEAKPQPAPAPAPAPKPEAKPQPAPDK